MISPMQDVCSQNVNADGCWWGCKGKALCTALESVGWRSHIEDSGCIFSKT